MSVVGAKGAELTLSSSKQQPRHVPLLTARVGANGFTSPRPSLAPARREGTLQAGGDGPTSSRTSTAVDTRRGLTVS